MTRTYLGLVVPAKSSLRTRRQSVVSSVASVGRGSVEVLGGRWVVQGHGARFRIQR